jgi:hypothetical protein
MFEENGLETVYVSFNNTRHTSVYIFAIGSRLPEKWRKGIGNEFSCECKGDLFDSHEHMIGCRAISNSLFLRISHKLFLKFFNHDKLKKLTEE